MLDEALHLWYRLSLHSGYTTYSIVVPIWHNGLEFKPIYINGLIVQTASGDAWPMI